MKNTKKILSVILSLLLVIGMMSTFAFAQDVTYSGEDASDATITINNASKGIEYKIYRIFAAKITGTDGGSITYQKISESLPTGFTENASGNIKVEDGVDDATIISNLKSYVTENSLTPTATATANGTKLVFEKLPYGYYYVTSAQGSEVTVTSTNKNAVIYDKNQTKPGGENFKKTVNNDNVYIGETVTYTVTYPTTNYIGEGKDAKQVRKYTVTDTLPDFLSDVELKSVVIYPSGYGDTTDPEKEYDSKELEALKFGKGEDKNGSFDITWATEDKDSNGSGLGTYTSLYSNGAVIVIKYSAVVTDRIAIAGEGSKNEVSFTYTTVDGTTTPKGGENITEETITSYALAIKKIDEKGIALTGAEFSIKGYSLSEDSALTTTYGVKTYKVTGKSDEAKGEFSVGTDGQVLIVGLKSEAVEITETKAPDGYHKLSDPVKISVQKMTTTTTTTTKYIDSSGEISDTETNIEVKIENNNVAATPFFVINDTGTKLPETGGIGTTIFYIAGAILVIGAGVVFVTRRRMHSDN